MKVRAWMSQSKWSESKVHFLKTLKTGVYNEYFARMSAKIGPQTVFNLIEIARAWYVNLMSAPLPGFHEFSRLLWKK